MSVITASAIAELRAKTGAGMMDCKKALAETSGDFEAAVDWLRKKGLSAAAKKSGRVAAEGLVLVAQTKPSEAAVIELNSETDFVAKNTIFQQLGAQIAATALSVRGDVEALKSAPLQGKTVQEQVAELVGQIGENLQLRRSAWLSVSQGVVAAYIHNVVCPQAGKIGVLLGIESAAPVDKLQEFGKKIAMHIAAARPESLHIESLDPALIEREKAIFSDQARASGKSEEIIEKMVGGRIRKFYEEAVLLEQVFVMDGKTKISEVVAQAAKDLGSPVALTGFVRFQLGEGIEKKESNFAEEVAAAASGGR